VSSVDVCLSAAEPNDSISCVTTSRSRSTWRWTKSSTSPASPHRFTTSSIPCRRPRPAWSARSICWASQNLKVKVLKVSTSEIYGDPLVHRQRRQSDRNSILLRGSEAVRRNAVLRLWPPTQYADQGRPHLQHLRAADAPERRARGVEVHRVRLERTAANLAPSVMSMISWKRSFAGWKPAGSERTLFETS
jgi:hypothetical protein